MTESATEFSAAIPPLCEWYERSHREYPWRENPTAYRVWVSEIMLQQTRIETVMPYFKRFMATLPDVYALAGVPHDHLMKLWEGLGYYSRAQNLQKAAQTVVQRYGGELPADYRQLIALPGIGPYTAGAIASIAYGKPVAAVDGNALRVFARLTACEKEISAPATKKELSALITELLPRKAPGVFNQAVMELGERVCLPRVAPLCNECPVASWCLSAKNHRAQQLPLRARAAARKIQKRTVLVLVSDEHTPRVLLHLRPKTGLLGGMWEFPGYEGFASPALPDVCGNIVCETWVSLPESRHRFTHLEWHMKGYMGVIPAFSPPQGWRFVSAEGLSDYALPSAFRAYSKHLPEWLQPKENHTANESDPSGIRLENKGVRV